MSNKWCLCFGSEAGFTTLGMLQLNAALYFWARLSCFAQYYWPIDILFGGVYTYRVYHFFLTVSDPTTANKQAYANAQYYSTYVLFLAAGIVMTMLYLEWAHLPLLQVVSWSFIACCNYANYQFLASYSGLQLRSDRGSYVEQKDVTELKQTKVVVLNRSHEMY